jgi:hypothetical protein
MVSVGSAFGTADLGAIRTQLRAFAACDDAAFDDVERGGHMGSFDAIATIVFASLPGRVR